MSWAENTNSIDFTTSCITSVLRLAQHTRGDRDGVQLGSIVKSLFTLSSDALQSRTLLNKRFPVTVLACHKRCKLTTPDGGRGAKYTPAGRSSRPPQAAMLSEVHSSSASQRAILSKSSPGSLSLAPPPPPACSFEIMGGGLGGKLVSLTC